MFSNIYNYVFFSFSRFSFLSVVCQDFVVSSPKVLAKNYNDVQNIVDVLSNNVDDDKLMVIKEHFRLV